MGLKRRLEKTPLQGSSNFLSKLKAHPGFKELEDIRSMCGRYMDEDGLSVREEDDGIEETDVLPEGLGHDAFKDQEMLDKATDWARDYDGVMAHLQLMAACSKKGSKAPWPKGVPVFEGPSEMIEHFKGRWEKLKCRYC